jgi:hypothetical protein
MVKFVEFPFMVKPMLPVDTSSQQSEMYRKLVFYFVFTINSLGGRKILI